MMMSCRRTLLYISLFCFTLGEFCLNAQSEGNRLAFERAGHLRRGINTSIWFAQSPADYTVARLRAFTTEQDVHLIASLGFDHIRLSVDPVPLTAWKNGKSEGTAFMGELDRVVKAALSDKLAIIIDIHPENNYKQRLLQGNADIVTFVELWRSLAEQFKNTDPEMVFFELMNEPEQTDGVRWQGIESTVADAIRSVDTAHTLIATGAHWSSLEDLLNLEPISDSNVIYTFHDYEPFAFTHQGATWAGSELNLLRHVPYPANDKNIADNLDQEPTLAGRLFVEKYAMDHWDAERIERTLAFAEQWSRKHHAPVYCGEFGVHRPYVDPAARERWLRDTRIALEKHGIGWAMWDYQTNFGVVTKAGDHTEVDGGVVRALGLLQVPRPF
jgi:aryl-phospho-beta-D-glucosidase BglC (GH1 family)